LRQQAQEMVLSETMLEQAAITLDSLEASARADVAAQGIAKARIYARRTLHLKYEGTDTTLETGIDGVAGVVAEFERKYQQQYGFLMPGRALIVEAVAVEA